MSGQAVEREEFRVTGLSAECPPIVEPVPFERFAVASLGEARKHVEFEQGYGSTNLRIQTRIVTETPWEDVEGSGDV